jgi:hypothetical protein
MRFTGAVQFGCYGRGYQVRSGTALTALMAIGAKITLDTGVDPTKVTGSEKYRSCIRQMIKGWEKMTPTQSKNSQ